MDVKGKREGEKMFDKNSMQRCHNKWAHLKCPYFLLIFVVKKYNLAQKIYSVNSKF
jgi:hypothetical protein